MAVDHDIFEAFFQRVSDNATLTVAYPAVSFTPPENASWLELLVMPNRTTDYGLSTSGPVVHRGLLQVNVVARPDAGILEATTVAEEMLLLFAKGTQLGLARVNRKPYISAVVDDTQAGKVYVPVTISYEAFINNQGPEVLSGELIDADVDLDSDSGWSYGARFTGFDGSVAYDESDPDTDPMTAPTTGTLEAGDHRLVVALQSGGAFLRVEIGGHDAGVFYEEGIFSRVYVAVGDETDISIFPSGEVDVITGVLLSVSLKRIL